MFEQSKSLFFLHIFTFSIKNFFHTPILKPS